jgi:tRNA (guanine-N7-)-methyltransferase
MSPRVRHRIHGNPFNIRGDIDVPCWDELFGRAAPLALDVGFGGGDFTIGLARQHPEWNVLGIEIRHHLVERLAAAARREELDNLHAIVANANLHLDSLLPQRSVAFVAVNFPDPWFKRRHHKRRVVRAEWLRVLAPKLQAGAEVHVATDYEPIGEEIRELLEAAPDFVNRVGAGAFAGESTTGIASERERAHSRRGAPIYRLWYSYRG